MKPFRMLILLLTFIVCFVACVRYLESRSVFFPEKNILSTPKQLGVEFEDIYFKTSDQLSLNGWLIKNPNAVSTVLYLHGNAGNISDRIEKISAFHALGLNVFIIDYRGYGKSEGKPSEQGIYTDALAAFDFLSERIDILPTTIWAYGGSLGGVVAIDLATKRNLKALIVDASFSSAADIAKGMYPFIPSFLLSTKMDSESKVKSITIPKMFIHSREDEVVPFRLGQKLFDAAASPKEFLEIKGVHNDQSIFSEDIWNAAMKKFLKGSGLIQ